MGRTVSHRRVYLKSEFRSKLHYPWCEFRRQYDRDAERKYSQGHFDSWRSTAAIFEAFSGISFVSDLTRGILTAFEQYLTHNSGRHRAAEMRLTHIRRAVIFACEAGYLQAGDFGIFSPTTRWPRSARRPPKAAERGRRPPLLDPPQILWEAVRKAFKEDNPDIAARPAWQQAVEDFERLCSPQSVTEAALWIHAFSVRLKRDGADDDSRETSTGYIRCVLTSQAMAGLRLAAITEAIEAMRQAKAA